MTNLWYIRKHKWVANALCWVSEAWLKGTYCMISLIWCSCKGKTVSGHQGTRVGIRGSETKEGIFSGNEYLNWSDGCLIWLSISQNLSNWTIKRGGFTKCKLHFNKTKQKQILGR